MGIESITSRLTYSLHSTGVRILVFDNAISGYRSGAVNLRLLRAMSVKFLQYIASLHQRSRGSEGFAE